MLLDLLTLEEPRGSIRPRRIGWELFDDEPRYKTNVYPVLTIFVDRWIGPMEQPYPWVLEVIGYC